MINKDDLLDFMQAVELKTGCAVYVAGGYLRDTENGVAPKDVDMMVVVPETSSIHSAREFCQSVSNGGDFVLHGELIEACEYMEDMLARGVEGLVSGCIKHGGQTSLAQFVVYNKHMTQQQLTEDMDINICQITMDSRGETVRTKAYMDGFHYAEVVVLHDYSDKRKVSRLKRMLAKYPDFEAPQLAAFPLSLI